MERNISTLPISFEISTNSNYGLNSLSKTKQNHSSAHRKHENSSHQFKSNQLLSSKSKSHTRQNSHLRKSKSKCDTEINISGKKKRNQYETTSKKTIKKKKTNANQNKGSFQSNRVSVNKQSKNKEQSIILKSTQKKQKATKQVFHSTCFSRNYDLDQMESGIRSPGGSRVIYPDKKKPQIYDKQFIMQRVYEKTRHVLDRYKKKCEILDKNCQYYESQLNKALRQLKQLKQFRRDGVQEKERNRESVEVFSSIKKENRKNRAKTNMTRNSKGKNSSHKEYGINYIGNDSEIMG